MNNVQPAFDLTPYLTQLLTVVITGAVALISWAINNFIKTHTTQTQQDIIEQLATTGVQAAEQVYGATDGEQKRLYAIGYVTKELERRDIPIDAAAILASVEAAVLREFNFPQGTVTVEVPKEPEVEPPFDDDVVPDSVKPEGGV